jgi:hypothetical protein
MDASERFDEYMDHLSQGLGHADRHAGLKGRPCKTATISMDTGGIGQLGLVRTLGFVCNDAQFLGVLRT